jgi:hypothetical protein
MAQSLSTHDDHAPHYPDISTLAAIDFSKDNTKRAILKGTWEDAHKFTFPPR